MKNAYAAASGHAKKYISSLIIFFIFIIFLITIFIFIIYSPDAQTKVNNGRIHCSRLDSNSPIMLNGTWEYYENQFLFPSNFHTSVDLPSITEYVQVPGSSPKPYGYGTYRLQFDFTSSGSLFAIKTSDFRSMARIYIDGTLISNVGFTSTIQKSSAPAKDDQYVVFPLNTLKKSHELIIQIANYDFYKSGITSPIYFGTQMNVYRLSTQLKFIETVGIMSIGFLAILLILILFLRIQMGNILHLLGFTLCFAFYIISYGHELIATPISSAAYIILTRLMMINFSLMGLFLLLFLNPNQHANRFIIWVFRIMCVFCPLLTGLTLFSNPVALPYLFNAYILYLSAALTLAYLLLITRMINQRQSAIIQIIALSLFVAFIVLQYLNSNGYVTSSSYVTFYILSIIGYVVAQLSYVALRISRIYTGNARLAQQMVVTDKMKNELMAITSHELRTPLHGMISIIESIAGKHWKDPALSNDLALTLTLAQRMRGTINDLYGFDSARSSGARDMRPANLQIEISAILEILHYTHSNQNITIANRISADASLVYADESCLWQILNNLIGNALKYTTKGNITISSRRISNKIHVSVTDTGIGMSTEEAATIFQKNVRLSHGERQAPGHGLGLYITKQLIEQMKGTINVTWSSPNKGTCLTFTLDACELEEYTIAQFQSSKIAKNQPSSSGHLEVLHPEYARILAVDDNSANLEIVRITFEDCGYIIDCCQNCSEAQALLNENTYDIVILDVMLPEVSGFEMCRSLRSRYNHFELPVLLLTARNSTEDVLTGFWSGANDYVVKPADRVELRARVFSLIALHQSVNTALENELLFLQAQIHPHFLYNAFNTISAIALTDGIQASELIDDLGTYLHRCFGKNNMNNDMVSFDEELQMLEAYVRIEKSRFGERLQFELQLELNEPFMLPVLTIQPLIENAIRHGSMDSYRTIHVILRVRRTKCQILIEVTDNGNGIEPAIIAAIASDQPKTEKTGVGLRNVNRRMKLKYNQPLIIENLDNHGTRVTLMIPSKAPTLITPERMHPL